MPIPIAENRLCARSAKRSRFTHSSPRFRGKRLTPAQVANRRLSVRNAQKLRTEVGRAVSAGRSRESFLGSVAPSLREYKEVESFAGQLFDALSAK